MRFALVAGLVLVGSTSVASPPATAKPHEVRLRDRAIVTVLPARARSAFASLARQGWRASWDRDTGVPARLWGGYVAAPGAVADAAVAERAARAFLAAHLDLLAPGARPGDFVVLANHLDDGVRTVGFAQTWRGRPVVGGQLGFVFAHDRLFAIGSSAWPDVSAALPAKGGHAILPLVRSGAIAYHAVDVVEVSGKPGERWRVYRDPSGRELARESLIMTGTSTLHYNAGIRHARGARKDFAVPAANITVDGSPITTGTDGSFSWTGTAPASVAPSLDGTYVRVVNQAGAAATATLTAQSGQPVAWSLASDELGDAQLSTYIYANIAKARARTVNPAVAPWLDGQLAFYVNENGICNAFSTGDDVHLFRADGTTCENTGRLADVVFHEFGHSLHNHSVIPGMGKFESHLSEGLADFFAANLTEDPAVGRGFYLDDSPLRDIDPVGSERVYPLDFDFDPHVSGLIIAGALWDLRKALIEQLGAAAGVARAEKIFTGIMQRADDIGTTFTAALIADDDDGNLGNYTPNYCAIERAFGTHGLVPGFATTRVSPPVVEDLVISVTVDTPQSAMCAPPTVVAIRVTWRAGDGVPSSFDLVSQGGTWTGAFPDQPEGTVLSYALDVVFDDGSVQAFPNNPADPRYQLFVGRAVPIYCESFDTDPMWEQSSNAGFEWQWARPLVGRAGGDPDAPHTGDYVLGTDLTTDGAYRPNLVVATATPAIDVSMYERVHLQYWRWLTVEDAAFDQATIAVNHGEVWRNAKSQNGILDHVDREWRFHDLDITPQVTDGSVQIEWGLSTDFGKELGGWTLDDVCVVGLVEIPRCGDGVVDVGEQCDDGNTTSGDGCDRACVDEITAGGGGCCDAGNAAPGNLVLVIALGLLRRRRLPLLG